MEGNPYVGFYLLGAVVAIYVAFCELFGKGEKFSVPFGEVPLAEGRSHTVGNIKITPFYFNGGRGREQQKNVHTNQVHFRTFRWAYVKGIPVEVDSLIE